MNRIAVLVLVLVASPTRADNSAAGLLDAADKMLGDKSCRQGGCAQLAEALQSYDDAMRADPTPATAGRICRFIADRMQPADQKRIIADGRAYRVLARCDFAARHPDSDPATRKLGGGGKMIREWLRGARYGTPEGDAQLDAAARALYGVGLVVKHDKATNQVTIEPGTFDANLVQQYIADSWNGYLGKTRSAHGGVQEMHPQRADYTKLGEQGVYGWTLLEPGGKLDACVLMSKDMTDANGRALRQFCKVQTLLELNAPRFVYRGATVNHDAGAPSGIPYDERVFLPNADGVYPIAIVVAAPTTIDSFATLRLQRKYADQLFRGAPDAEKKEALVIAARAEKLLAQKQKTYNAAKAKFAGRGGKIAFADAPFDGDFPRVLKKGETTDCDKLHFNAFGFKTGDYEVELDVDKQACATQPLGSLDSDVDNTDSLAHPSDTRAYDNCATLLKTPGDHTVSIGMYKVGTWETGNKEITDDLRIRDQTVGVRGKRVARATVTCTTK